MSFEVVRDAWHRRKWLAIVVFVLTFAVIASIVASLPNLYRSTVTVLVERHQVSETFVRPSITGELETRLQTITQEILSRARLEALIQSLKLYQDPSGRVPTEALVDRLRRDIRLDLRSVDNSGRGPTIAFALRYQGRDPETVALVANTLASFYVTANTQLREQQAAGTAEFLRTQLAEMSKRVTEQEQRVREFRMRYAGELPEQSPANLATMERLHAQIQLNSAEQSRALDRRAALWRQLRETTRLSETRVAGVPDMPNAVAGEITKLKQQLAVLQQRFTDRYPEVMRVQSEIAALERTVESTRLEAPATPSTEPLPSRVDPIVGIQAALADAESEVDRFKAEDTRLRRAVAVYQQRIDNAPQREQEFRELSRDYDMTKELQGSLLKRYEDARLADTMEQRQRGEQFRILDPALPSSSPAAPNRTAFLLAGFLLSLGAAAAVVVLAEQVDTSFHTVNHLKTISRAPVVVSIPLIVTEADRRRRTWRFAFAAVAVTVTLALLIKASQYVATGNEFLIALLARGGA